MSSLFLRSVLSFAISDFYLKAIVVIWDFIDYFSHDT